MKELFSLRWLFSTEVGYAAGITTILGQFATLTLGSANTKIIIALILIIVADWFAGISASLKDGSYASAYGLQGLLRTVVMLVLPAVGYLLDDLFGVNILFYALVGGIGFHTWVSFTANMSRAGWDKWIPKRVLDGITSEIEAKMARSNGRKIIDKEKGNK